MPEPLEKDPGEVDSEALPIEQRNLDFEREKYEKERPAREQELADLQLKLPNWRPSVARPTQKGSNCGTRRTEPTSKWY